jgi:adenylate cyclase
MAYRGIVFVVTVVIALVIGLFARRGEIDATRAQLPWPGAAELRAQDTLQRLRLGRSPHPDVVIVAADDKSVKKYGKLPWRRDIWARGLRPVQAGAAKAAVFDIALDKRSANAAADRALWRMMAGGRRTILGMGYNGARRQKWTVDEVRALRFLEKFAIADKLTLRGAAAAQVFPWPLFEAPVSDFTGSARGVGVFLRETDRDGVVRHARLLYRSKVQTPPTTTPLPGSLPESRLNNFDVALPSLSLAGALHKFELDKTYVRAERDTVQLAGKLDPPVVIPIDSFARMVINFAGPAGTYETVSFADVAEGKIATRSFRDKVVIFGATAGGAKETDRRRTPEGEMARVEITANAIGSILGRSYLTRARGNDVLGALVALGVIAGLLLARARVGTVLTTGVVLTLLYLAAAWCLLAFLKLLAPILPALLFFALATALAVALRLIFTARARTAVRPSAPAP